MKANAKSVRVNGRQVLNGALVAAALAVAPLVIPAVASGQISALSYTGTTYSQDFNGLGTSTVNVPASGQISQLPGWVFRSQNNSTPPLTAGDGSSNGGGFYNVGTSGSSDRAVGSIGSTNPTNGGPFNYGVILQNNSGTDYTNIDLSFFIEQWRYGGASANENNAFSYGVVSTLPASATAFASLSLTSSASLSQGIINTNGGTAGATNGNNAAFRSQKSANALSVPWTQSSYLVLRWTDVDSASSDSLLAVDDLSVKGNAGAAAKVLTWTGSANGAWDTSTANWTSNAASATFATNDLVTFDDSASGTTNVVVAGGGVQAGSITFNNSSLNYSLSGGGLTGSGNVTKNGSGSATFAQAVSGTVQINAGKVVLASGASLASVPVLNGGTLESQITTSVTGLSVTSTGGTVSVLGGQTLTVANSLSGGTNVNPSKLIKAGDGTLAFTTFFVPSTQDTSVILAITGGNVQLNQTSGTRGFFVAPEWATATSGDLTFNGAFRTNLTADTTLVSGGQAGLIVGDPSSTGKVIFNVGATNQQFSSLIADRFSTGSGFDKTFDLNLQVTLNLPSADKYAGLGANGINQNDNFQSNTLNVNKPIVGIGTLVFGTNIITGPANAAAGTSGPVAYTVATPGTNSGAGQGVVALNASGSTFNGQTIIALGQYGLVRLGADNALPNATTLRFGDVGTPTNVPIGSLDLNGKSVTVGGVVSSANFTTLGGIVNNTPAGTATLTIGSSNDYSYSGPVGFSPYNNIKLSDINSAGGNGNGLINIIKNGSGTQTFSGNVSTTGTATVNAGKLVFSGQVAPSLSQITGTASGAVEFGPQADATYAGNIGTVGVVKSNSTRLTLTGSISSVGGFTVLGGTLAVPGNTQATYSSSTVGSLVIAAGSTFEVAESTGNLNGFTGVKAPTLLVASGLVSNSGTIQLSNNDLLIRSGSGLTIDQVAAQIRSGAISSLLDNGTVGLNVYAWNFTGVSFDGVELVPGDILVNFGLRADVNLDGVVDGADYRVVQEAYFLGSLYSPNDFGIATQTLDLNRSGTIDEGDISFVDAQLGGTLVYDVGASVSGGVSQIPEPASMGLLVAGLPLATRRRRR